MCLVQSAGKWFNLNCSVGTSGAPAKKVEMDGIGDVNGVPLFEYDVDAHDKPWKLPGKIMYSCIIKDTIPRTLILLQQFCAQVHVYQ